MTKNEKLSYKSKRKKRKNKNMNFLKKITKLEVVVVLLMFHLLHKQRREEVPNKEGELKAQTCKQ